MVIPKHSPDFILCETELVIITGIIKGKSAVIVEEWVNSIFSLPKTSCHDSKVHGIITLQ